MKGKVAGGKGISETKSKQQSPCSNCMHRPVMSWGNTCSTCIHWPVTGMHQPVMSQANACTCCMGSKVSSLFRIYLYPYYFDEKEGVCCHLVSDFLNNFILGCCWSEAYLGCQITWKGDYPELSRKATVGNFSYPQLFNPTNKVSTRWFDHISWNSLDQLHDLTKHSLL